jgi:hypothetical protein
VCGDTTTGRERHHRSVIRLVPADPELLNAALAGDDALARALRSEEHTSEL